MLGPSLVPVLVPKNRELDFHAVKLCKRMCKFLQPGISRTIKHNGTQRPSKKTCYFFSAPVQFWTSVTGWIVPSPAGIAVKIRWPSAETS